MPLASRADTDPLCVGLNLPDIIHRRAEMHAVVGGAALDRTGRIGVEVVRAAGGASTPDPSHS